ncbi:TIGR03943 family putative permease subunit [Ectobacillus panaciterrae]|uniref:TIGR03943 family putative permease subunit n=1 Tax=Ectobacillus panaciterrae TaxID=363872 RepID=UPI00041FF2BE|nr:TIGR03943 family protein [Ectobacillus panaciterrae]
MFRAYILLGFTFLIAQLHISGNITKYINMKYAYLSKSAAVIMAFLTVVQVIMAFKKDNHHDHGCSHLDCGCGHHPHEQDRWWKRAGVYSLFLFPIISGLFFPIATLDSNIVKAKGFHFPVSDPGNTDPFIQRQFLKPDLSIYYGAEGYRSLMEKEKKSYVKQDSIVLNDVNFLQGMEVIYNYPGEFIGKELSFQGFVFHDKGGQRNEYFLFRFGIIHCIADSGVYGMMIQKPADANWKDDDWIRVQGTIGTTYYQPFHATIPVLKITKWVKVEAPKDQYVYRGA